MAKLHEDGLPFLVLQRLEAGERRTMRGWAEVLGISYQQFSHILVVLRKCRHHYHPTDRKVLVNGVPMTGIVVDIMKSESSLRDGLAAYEYNQSKPRIVSLFRTLETAIAEYPELGMEIQSYIDNIQAVAIESRKRLRSAERLQLTEGNQ